MAEIQKFINEHPFYSLVGAVGLLLALATMAIVATFLFTGPPSEERVLEKLQGANALNLEIEAEEIWLHSNDYRTLKKSEWSKEARKFNPKSIIVDDIRGVFFEVRSIFLDSDGLFYLPKDSKLDPQKESDLSLKHIGGRLYYYKWVS